MPSVELLIGIAAIYVGLSGILIAQYSRGRVLPRRATRPLRILAVVLAAKIAFELWATYGQSVGHSLRQILDTPVRVAPAALLAQLPALQTLVEVFFGALLVKLLLDSNRQVLILGQTERKTRRPPPASPP